MRNFREILLQIIDVLGIQREWKDHEVDDFLAIAQVEAMMDLIEALPKYKQAPMIKQLMGMPNKTPRAVEGMFGRYYTVAQMQEAVVSRTKQSITKHVVELSKVQLTPAQRERIHALLEQLTY